MCPSLERSVVKGDGFLLLVSLGHLPTRTVGTRAQGREIDGMQGGSSTRKKRGSLVFVSLRSLEATGVHYSADHSFCYCLFSSDSV